MRRSPYANAQPSCSTVSACCATLQKVFGHHMGVDIDTTLGFVSAPETKLTKIAN
jgi:hypothetical protein